MPARHRAPTSSSHLRTLRVAPFLAILAIVASVGATVANLLLPLMVGRCITALLNAGPVTSALAGLSAAVALSVAMNTLESLAGGGYAVRVTAGVRAAAIRHVVDGDPDLSEPESAGTASVATRLLVDARQPAQALPMVTEVWLAGVSLVIALFALLTIDWWLVVGLVIGLLMVIVLLRRLVLDTVPLVARYRAIQSELGQRLVDAQRGAMTIRALGTWRREGDRVLAPLSDLRDAGDELWQSARRFGWRTGVFVPLALLLTVATGGAALAAGRISVGEFAAALGYAGLVLSSLDAIEALAGLNLVRVGRQRIETLLRRRIRPAGNQLMRGGAALDLSVENVTVIEDGHPVLANVSAIIAHGTCVAITGDHLSGRSLLANVIAGARSPDSGEVCIDRMPIAGLFSGERRGLIALASARPPMLGGTVSGLIGLGVPDVCDRDIRSAAKRARIADVIDGLPLGYNTPLEHLRLSGGEAQRLGIAQALVRRPEILVLDDATSSLDIATEQEVMRAVVEMSARRTTILVTNRPTLLAHAEQIISLVDGNNSPFAMLNPES